MTAAAWVLLAGCFIGQAWNAKRGRNDGSGAWALAIFGLLAGAYTWIGWL